MFRFRYEKQIIFERYKPKLSTHYYIPENGYTVEAAGKLNRRIIEEETLQMAHRAQFI